MSKLKIIIKTKLPFLMKIYAIVVAKLTNARMMHYNRKYKRAITKLMNPQHLAERIENIKSKNCGTYYIVATQNNELGIYGYINCFLPHLAYALEKGYIPIVDMKNYGSIYQISNENAWEKFFNQPCGIGLDDIKDSRVVSCPTDFWYRWLPNSQPLMTDEEISMWSAVYKALIPYCKKSEEYLEDEKQSILIEPEKTIGVIYRGCAYTKGQAKGHPIQPTMKMLADMVDKMLKKNNCEFIYLASDEKSIVDYMEIRFPGKILINKRVFYDEENIDFSKYNKEGVDITACCDGRTNNEYLIGIEYISSMNLVAKCNCLVAGACGGTTAVLYMNGGNYKDKYVFQLGKYGQDPIPED